MNRPLTCDSELHRSLSSSMQRFLDRHRVPHWSWLRQLIARHLLRIVFYGDREYQIFWRWRTRHRLRSVHSREND